MSFVNKKQKKSMDVSPILRLHQQNLKYLKFDQQYINKTKINKEINRKIRETRNQTKVRH